MLGVAAAAAALLVVLAPWQRPLPVAGAAREGDAAPGAATLTAELADMARIGNYGPAPAGVVLFPDGTWLRPLNGVTDPPPFPGFADRPYAPVVSILTEPKHGVQWYLHADGTESTTQLAQTERGTLEPIWIVGTKIKPQPIH